MNMNAKSPVNWSQNGSTDVSGTHINGGLNALTQPIGSISTNAIHAGDDKFLSPTGRRRMKTVSYDDYKFGSEQAQEEAQRKFFKEEKERLDAIKALDDAKNRGADESEIQQL